MGRDPDYRVVVDVYREVCSEVRSLTQVRVHSDDPGEPAPLISATNELLRRDDFIEAVSLQQDLEERRYPGAEITEVGDARIDLFHVHLGLSLIDDVWTLELDRAWANAPEGIEEVFAREDVMSFQVSQAYAACVDGRYVPVLHPHWQGSSL